MNFTKHTKHEGIEIRQSADDDVATSLALPVGFRLSTSSAQFELTFRPQRLDLIILMPFAAFWNFGVGTFIVQAIRSRSWGALAFSSIHASVGLGMLWQIIAKIFGKTRVSIAGGVLMVHRRPLPSRFEPCRADDVAQLVVEQDTNLFKQPRRPPRFQIRLHRRDGSSAVLVNGLPTLDMASRLEQAIEQHLGIRNEMSGLSRHQ